MLGHLVNICPASARDGDGVDRRMGKSLWGPAEPRRTTVTVSEPSRQAGSTVSTAGVPPASEASSRPYRRCGVREVVYLCCWSYAAAVLLIWLLVVIPDPKFWPATLFLYGPRWVVVLPL